jgi:thiamine pyrophosphokinase
VARTAVIVIGGASIDARVLAHLPGDRLVIAADSGLDHALSLGLAVDLVVGDLDSVSPRGLAAAESAGVAIERHRPDKDATDTELAIVAAGRLGCRHLIDVSGGPRADETRLDHELGGILAFARPGLAADRIELWWGPAHLSVVHGPGSEEIVAPVGSLVSLLPLHGPASGVVTSGLRYPLRHETLEAGTGRGVSNEVAATPAAVRLDLGVLLVVRPLALGGPPCTHA